jgi:hypothetical protein
MTAAAERATTPWGAGRFDARPGPARLLFGRTFEDPAIEQDLFPGSGTVLCIASAGDTARALAAPGRSVTAVDVNPAQLAEVRRRLAGHAPRAGAADHLLALGRAALVPLGWRPARLERFCRLRDPAEQAAQWRRLASPAVRAAVRAALSPAVLRLAYGAPFAHLAPAGFGATMLDRIGARVTTSPNAENPWLARLLTGAWTRPDPPAGAAGRIDLRAGDVATVLEGLPPGALDGISLSNVLDGPGPAYAARLLAAAHRAGRPGAPIIVRSLLVDDDRDPGARRLAERDRSLLWGAITVHRAGGA